ncbi:TetR/AcrR family transcriptional regulator [Salinispira pacifica]
MRKREEERATDRRSQIVAAAFSVFGEKGFSATRVEDICRAAGIAKGTFYLYFRTREEIAEAIFEQVISRYRGRAERLAVSNTNRSCSPQKAAELLTAEVRSLASEARAGLRFVPVLFSILAERMTSGESELTGRLGGAFDGLASAWAKVLSAGNVSGASAGQLARTAVSMLDGVILHAALFSGPNTDLDVAVERLCAILASHIRGGVS